MIALAQLLDGETRQLLQGVAPPAAVITLFLLFAWRPWRRHPPVAEAGAWAVCLGLGLGFTWAFGALRGWAFLTPVGPMDWLPYLAITSALVGMAMANRVNRRVIVALALAGAWTVLFRLWTNRWDGGTEGLLHIALAGCVFVGLTACLVPLCQRSRGGILPAVLCLIASVAGFVLFGAAHSASLGQLSGALAVGLGACAAVGFCNPQFTLQRGGGLVVAMVLGGLLLNGYYSNYPYDDAPLLACGLVALAPLGAWVERCSCLSGKSLLLRGGATVTAVGIPLAGAAWFAWQTLAVSEY